MEPDWPEVAEKLRSGAYAAVGELLGVELTEPLVAQLLKLRDFGSGDRAFTLPSLLAIIYRGARDPLGIVHDVAAQGAWKTHALVVRRGNELAVGVKFGSYSKPDSHWHSLGGWSKTLAKNEKRCAIWAAEEPGLVKLKLRDGVKMAPAATGLDPFLRAVLDAPDDPAPRLVLADVLLERGDVRGQLIHLMFERERGWNTDVEARIKALLSSSGRVFAGAAAPYVDEGSFARGFVDTVTMTVAAFVKDGEGIFSTQPVRRLVVANEKWTAGDLRKLGAAPAMPRVRVLKLTQRPRKQGLALEPLAGGRFHALERLQLGYCGFTPYDWWMFFEQLQAPKLRAVQLEWSRTCAAMFRGLARNPLLSRLESIADNASDPLHPEALPDVMRELSVKRPSLRELRLSGKWVDDAAIAPFFDDDSAATLKRLSTSGASLTDVIVKKIAASPKAPALEEFEADGSRISLAGVKILLGLKTLRRLEISSYDDALWPDADVRAFAQLLVDLPADHALREVRVPRSHVAADTPLGNRFPRYS